MGIIISLFLIPTCCALLSWPQPYSFGAKGELRCEGEPAAGVKVQLYQRSIFVDRKLEEGLTDASGSFKLQCFTMEKYPNPVLKIYHRCNSYEDREKEIVIKIPSNYVLYGDIVKEYFDIKSRELA
ncbi:hypothetical protein Aduo_011607 [Ancylostoma duodenale]